MIQNTFLNWVQHKSEPSAFSGRRFVCSRSSVVLIPAPLGDIRNQFQRERFPVWKADGSFRCIIIGQLVLEGFHRLRSGVKANVVFGCGKLDQVPLLAESWHTPRYFFLCLWDGTADCVPDGFQVKSGCFILKLNILIDGFGLDTVMPLVLIFELPAAFWTFPHGDPSQGKS